MKKIQNVCNNNKHNTYVKLIILNIIFKITFRMANKSPRTKLARDYDYVTGGYAAVVLIRKHQPE